MKLKRITVDKVWGKRALPAAFPQPDGDEPLGEIWYERADGERLALMAKYLFTSERLSVQVHPNDDEARARGHPHGKEECWVVLDAERDSVLGLGTARPLSGEELREAATSGEIEGLIDWKPVRQGDVWVVPAGTVHAIGPGLTIVEVQQNIDLTYRLYDYGRPRELHLDDGVEVADARPYDMANHRRMEPTESQHLVDTAHFDLWRVVKGETEKLADWAAGRDEIQLLPLTGGVAVDGQAIGAGEAAVADSLDRVRLSAVSEVLVAAPKPSQQASASA